MGAVQMRYAIVKNTTACCVVPYLPAQYRVKGEVNGDTIICGIDQAGWTLDDYLIPRLATGLHTCKEITIDRAEALLALRATDEQREAARAFARAFGEVSTYGGGQEARLRLPSGDKVLKALDGWQGNDTALDKLGDDLAEMMVNA